MDKIINLLKCSSSGSSDNSLLYGYMTTKTYFKVPRWVWSLLLLCFIAVNALFVALCLSVDTSSILHYKSYDCKYIDNAAPSIIEYKSTTTADKYYYYILNVTMYHDDAGTGGQDLTVLSSVIWDDFCKTSSSSESKECLEDYIGSEHDDSFTCYAVQTSVERFTTKKVSSVGGKSINISLRKDLTSNYMGELYWTIPLALLIVFIIAIGYILFGFFYFDGRSKFSLDRFIRQVIKDPFMLSGDSTTYRLEESSSMNVILQDPTERQKEVLLRLDKRALLLSENTQDEEPTSQLQEMALASLDTNDDGNKVHPVYLLMRNTATEEHETILYYERPSTDNMKRCRKSTLKLLLAFWILIIPTFFIMFILAILSLVLLESIIISLCLWELSIIIVFFITHTSLVKLIPVYQGIHYMITSSRVVIIESLPLKLGYTLHCITHDKIGQVWHGSLNENHPTTHVTLEDRKEGQLLAEIKTNKDEATTGILFEYCTDVRSSIDLIEQRQGNSSNFSIE